MPCGLCLRPDPMCLWYLKKSPNSRNKVAVDFEKSTCANKMSFQYGAASTSSSKSPSSNVPVECPVCVLANPKSPAVWKYNLREHMRVKHPNVQLTPDIRIKAEIASSEKAMLKDVYADRKVAPQTRRSKKSKSKAKKLKISEAHSTRLALRCVSLYKSSFVSFIVFCA